MRAMVAQKGKSMLLVSKAKKLLVKVLKILLQLPVAGPLVAKFSVLALQISNKFNEKIKGFTDRLPLSLISTKFEVNEYNWTALLSYYMSLKNILENISIKPKISILIPVYKVKPEYLQETLQSVAIQIYENWEICIVDDCSGDSRLLELIESFHKTYPGKIKFSQNEVNSHISITSNNCLKLAAGEYIALLDHDDRLYPHSLAEIVRFINLHDSPDILYSDERLCDAAGEPLHDAYFKPDWSPFMHLCMNYTTHLSAYRTELVRQVGGFLKGYEGSQDHDLMLRMVEATSKPVVHIPFVLYQWRAHPESTAMSISSKPYAAIAGEKAVRDHLNRRNRPAKVNWEKVTQHYKIDFELPPTRPLVSIIIPTKNHYELISRCVESIFKKTSYPSYELIIVDNGTTEIAALNFLNSLEKASEKKVKILKDSRPFNFARMNNDAARVANGEYLLFLNNDTEVITPGWIEEMLMIAQFPEVGAVGPKLLFPTGRIQHAGVMLTDRSIAQHVGIDSESTHPLYCNALNTMREVSALTAACLLTKKSTFFEVSGFDEIWVPNGYGDIDFCIKLKHRSKSCIFTPHAELYHHESPTRKKSVELFERYYMISKHGLELMNDPFLNPFLLRMPYFYIDHSFTGHELSAAAFAKLLSVPKGLWTPETLRYGH